LAGDPSQIAPARLHSTPDPLVDLTALPRPLGDLRGPTSTGREKIKEREGKGRGEMGVEGRRRWMAPFQIPEYATGYRDYSLH